MLHSGGEYDITRPMCLCKRNIMCGTGGDCRAAPEVGELSGGILPRMRCLLAVAFSMAAMAALGAVEICPGKVSVVAAKGASPTVRFAAAEMTNCLSRVLGAAVPIASAPVDGWVNIFLGESEWSRAESLDPKPLVRDGFISAAKGKITGKGPVGNSVHHSLCIPYC